jgi:hypothetical protein
MRKYLSAALLTGALGVTITAALANPLLPMAPVAPAISATTGAVPIQTAVVNGYKSLRAFWLSRAVVR